MEEKELPNCDLLFISAFTASPLFHIPLIALKLNIMKSIKFFNS